MSKGSEKSKSEEGKEGLGTTLVLGAAIAAGGLGVYLATRKPPAIYLGDRLSISYCSFTYKGIEAELFLCWGLRKTRWGDFNNGENLAGGLWTWGGPIHVLESLDWKTYKINPQKELKTKPILYLNPDTIEPVKYGTYVWITANEPHVDRDTEFLIIDYGPEIDIKIQ